MGSRDEERDCMRTHVHSFFPPPDLPHFSLPLSLPPSSYARAHVHTDQWNGWSPGDLSDADMMIKSRCRQEKACTCMRMRPPFPAVASAAVLCTRIYQSMVTVRGPLPVTGRGLWGCLSVHLLLCRRDSPSNLRGEFLGIGSTCRSPCFRGRVSHSDTRLQVRRSLTLLTRSQAEGELRVRKSCW